jgi:hypothetical protein
MGVLEQRGDRLSLRSVLVAACANLLWVRRQCPQDRSADRCREGLAFVVAYIRAFGLALDIDTKFLAATTGILGPLMDRFEAAAKPQATLH